ncbi:hypothetical protein [Gordonibacter massiliensis (ex Traore et al. 2017)]|uniref:hypothetical protein n=1 Tax=Gordonibacter massiliensis (ex Traore et al. 2017) TaxID=1841863 RepID=UPI001C8BFE21|nr:hypothetical protein [Gordonibacter massiliensis (ex Traore et al. 2017)]MBX9035057.1 hypothetical protein [Gordonibacter massiliensis (ex Traore et al. 2017)]
MGGIFCSECGRDIDEIFQDNMSYTTDPLCEDCWCDLKASEPNDARAGGDDDGTMGGDAA